MAKKIPPSQSAPKSRNAREPKRKANDKAPGKLPRAAALGNDETARARAPGFPVVGIGASAGGLEAVVMLLKANARTYEISMAVVPFTTPPSAEKWLLVLFDDGRPVTESTTVPGKRENRFRDSKEAEIQRLRSELNASKESLQTIIEEQESTNEELTTLNEELSNRNLEMAQMNNDLTNLLSSINIPILMVDNGLAVRRATPLAEKLFNLIPTDIGRRLSDLKANLTIGNIDHLIREVLDSLTTREVKVQDTHGRWYSLHIRPYRTGDNKIDGAVITLVDIDEQQRNISRLELASHYTEAILETVRKPVVVLDPNLRVRKASRAFYKAFKLNPKKTDGIHFCKIGAGEWDVKQIRSLLEKTLPKTKGVADFKVELDFRNLGHRKLAFNTRRLDHKGEPLVLLAIEDITHGPRRLS